MTRIERVDALPGGTSVGHRTRLYVSDLDGTLLAPDGRLSRYTRESINRLIAERGLLFSFATARSYESAHAITGELDIRLPVVVYGGALTVDGRTGEILTTNTLPAEALATVLELCRDRKLPPLVYDFCDGADRVMWVEGAESAGIRNYISTRRGDRRLSPAGAWAHLETESTFYVTIIGEHAPIMSAARELREALAGSASVNAQQDTYYPEEYWLEISAVSATKGAAVSALRDRLGASGLVCFGDNDNDLSMFAVADRSYAMANGSPAVLLEAGHTISTNEEDGVARTLVSIFDR